MVVLVEFSYCSVVQHNAVECIVVYGIARMDNRKFSFFHKPSIISPLCSNQPSKEIDPMNPSSPYACSKASSEIMAHCYLQCYQLPLITIRATNVYGPHKFPENVGGLVWR